MTNENKANASKKNEDSKPIPEAPKQENKPIVNDSNPKIEDNKSDDKPSEKPNIVNPRSKKDGWDIASTIFNGIVAAGTVFAIIISAEALHSSNQAVELADSSISISRESLNESKRANDITYRSMENDSQINRKAIDIAELSMREQIKSFNESKKQFESINQPFLNCSEFNIDSIVENETIKISCIVKNLNDIPAKIINTATASGVQVNEPTKEDVLMVLSRKTVDVIQTASDYIIKESPLLSKSPTKRISARDVQRFYRGEIYIVFAKEYEYINLITTKKRKYSVGVIFKRVNGNTVYPNNLFYRYIYNENEDIN